MQPLFPRKVDRPEREQCPADEKAAELWLHFLRSNCPPHRHSDRGSIVAKFHNNGRLNLNGCRGHLMEVH